MWPPPGPRDRGVAGSKRTGCAFLFVFVPSETGFHLSHRGKEGALIESAQTPENARQGFTEPDLFSKVKKEPKVITTHGRPLSPGGVHHV